jgi:hypothetical protein
MSFATRGPVRLVLIAFVLFSLNTGCRENDGTEITAADFKPRTKGTPDELWTYVGEMHRRYPAAVPSSPAAARELLQAFTSAVITTLNAIIDNPSTVPEQRVEALRVLFGAYKKRESVDPNAEAELLEAIDRLEAKFPKSEVSTRAGEERARILGERIKFATDANRHEAYEAAVNAVIHVALAEPTPDRAKSAKILMDLASECERWRFQDTAVKIATVLTEKFSEFPEAAFAKGSLHRYGLKGKVIDDLEGKGRNDKLISIKDYRGKVVFAVFWVSFLEPFINEMVEIEKFRQKYDPKDFEVIGICLDPDPTKAMAIMNAKKIAWPQIYSRITDAEMNSEMTLRYGFKSAAFRMVIDREGKLVDFGPLFKEMQPELEKLLPPVVAKPETPATTGPWTTEPKPKD